MTNPAPAPAKKSSAATILGLYFLVLGAGLIVSGYVRSSIVIQFAGIAVSVFAAFLVNFPGTDAAVQKFFVYAGPYIPGGKRFPDPTADGTPKPPTFP